LSKYSLYSAVIIILVALVAIVVQKMPGKPGALVPARMASKHRNPDALKFYHLKNVQTSNHPVAAWKMVTDGGVGSSYVFTGKNGQVIDSVKDPKGVLEKVVDVKNNQPIVTGADIKPNAQANLDPAEGCVILIEFTPEGGKKFEEFTRKNIDEFLAIFFEGKLITSPNIKTAIPGGKAHISGFASMGEAKRAVEMLN
jgi:preprotein translocase subunit SecD